MLSLSFRELDPRESGVWKVEGESRTLRSSF